MRLWAYLQDNTVPGCGEPECCGEAYEELDWSFHLGVEPMTEEQLVEEHGGGPLLKIRQATKKEARGYWAGHAQGVIDGYEMAEQQNLKTDNQENLDYTNLTGVSAQIRQAEDLHERTKNAETEPQEPLDVAYSARTSEFVSDKKLLDPAKLTPESLYELQSKTWAQGVEYERDLWRSRIERIRTWNPTSSADFHEGALTERMRIIDLIRDTYTDHDLEETGSFVYSEDIVELIEKDIK